MTDISINMLLIGIVALCLGIAWVVFKSLQWAASAPEAERKVEGVKPVEGKPISFPEWKKSIVVLPFENLGRPEDDYFAAGMTEEIISRLAVVPEIGVISRTTAVQYDRAGKTVPQIGKDLGVDYVLEGTVRWDHLHGGPGRIRITPQLIRVADDTHLWAQLYDRIATDLFQI